MTSVALSWPSSSQQPQQSTNGQPGIIFAVPDPHFSYIERFEDGAAYSGISSGGGRFVDTAETSRCRSPHLAFTVEKDRVEKTIAVGIKSPSLSATIFRALINCGSNATHLSIDFETLVKDYESLKAHLSRLEADDPSAFSTRELRLLVEDLLLDRGLFEGIGTENFCQPNILCRTHLSDINQRSVDAGFDEVHDCFALGLLSDSITIDRRDVLRDEYLELVRSSDFLGLHKLSERLLNAQGAHVHKDFMLLAKDHEPPENDHSQKSISQAGEYYAHNRLYPSSNLQASFIEGIRVQDTTLAATFLQEGNAAEGYRLEGARSCAPYCNPNVIVSDYRGSEPSYGFCKTEFVMGEEEAEDGGFRAARQGKDATILADLPRLHPSSHLVAQEGNFVPLSVNDSEAADTRLAENKALERDQIHTQRRNLGRSMTVTLGQLCEVARGALINPQSPGIDATLDLCFSAPAKIWQRGLAAFRQVIYNQPPQGLADVLSCLLVTGAICAAIPVDNEWIHQQFVNDLSLWRVLLEPQEQVVFDRVAFSLWAYTDTRDPVVKNDERGDIVHFEDLIQHVVITQNEGYANRRFPPSLLFPFLTRLKTIHFEHRAKREDLSEQHQADGPTAIPIAGDSARKRTWGDSFDMSPDSSSVAFSIEEFFDVKSFLSQSVDTETETHEEGVEDLESLCLKDISRTTMDILSSVAFSIMFTFIIGLHIGFDKPALIKPWNRSRGYKRSCEILKTFLETLGIQEDGSTDPNTVLRLQSVVSPSDYLNFSALSVSNDRRLRPARPSTSMPVSMRFPKPRLEFPDRNPCTISPHPPSPAEDPRDARRLSCPQCQRSFSTLGNRNKHMREGCAMREKNGYRCRNTPCTKILTTKWYRNTHEMERCRYRGAQPGMASST